VEFFKRCALYWGLFFCVLENMSSDAKDRGDERQPANMRLACIGMFQRADGTFAAKFQKDLQDALEEIRMKNAPRAPAGDSGQLRTTQNRPWGLIFSNELELSWPAETKDPRTMLNFFKHNKDKLQEIERIIKAGPRSVVLYSNAQEKKEKGIANVGGQEATGKFDGFLFCVPHCDDFGEFFAEASILMDDFYPKPQKIPFKRFVAANSSAFIELADSCHRTAYSATRASYVAGGFVSAVSHLEDVIAVTGDVQDIKSIRDSFATKWHNHRRVFLQLVNPGTRFPESDALLATIDDVLKWTENVKSKDNLLKWADDAPPIDNVLKWFLRRMRRSLLGETGNLDAGDAPPKTNLPIVDQDLLAIPACAFVVHMLRSNANKGWRTRYWIASNGDRYRSYDKFVPSVPDEDDLTEHTYNRFLRSFNVQAAAIARAIYDVHREKHIQSLTYFSPELYAAHQMTRDPRAMQRKKDELLKEADTEKIEVHPRPIRSFPGFAVPMIMGFLQGKYRV
jgi:hypothetical protein